jgi:hypothetical protein
VRFDYYAATISAPPLEVVNVLLDKLGADDFKQSKGLHGYQAKFDLVDREHQVMARVLGGGTNPNPNAWAEGDRTSKFVDVVREVWPKQHRVTRFDTCLDFDAPGAFERLLPLVMTVQQDHAISWRPVGFPPEGVELGPDTGRTVYLGSPKSPVMVRFYEKGKQLRSKGGPEVDAISRDWVRLEVQARPHKEMKIYAASKKPEDVWRFSRWSKDLAERVLEVDLPKLDTNFRTPTDDARAFFYLIQQYGPLLKRLKDKEGTWANVGHRIGRAIAVQEQALARNARAPT